MVDHYQNVSIGFRVQYIECPWTSFSIPSHPIILVIQQDNSLQFQPFSEIQQPGISSRLHFQYFITTILFVIHWSVPLFSVYTFLTALSLATSGHATLVCSPLPFLSSRDPNSLLSEASIQLHHPYTFKVFYCLLLSFNKGPLN